MIKERKTVMKKYYLQVTIDSNLDASTKAVQDCNKILHQNGFAPFEVNLYKSGNKYIKKVHNFLAFNHLNKIDEEETSSEWAPNGSTDIGQIVM